MELFTKLMEASRNGNLDGVCTPATSGVLVEDMHGDLEGVCLEDLETLISVYERNDAAIRAYRED